MLYVMLVVAIDSWMLTLEMHFVNKFLQKNPQICKQRLKKLFLNLIFLELQNFLMNGELYFLFFVGCCFY